MVQLPLLPRMLHSAPAGCTAALCSPQARKVNEKLCTEPLKVRNMEMATHGRTEKAIKNMERPAGAPSPDTLHNRRPIKHEMHGTLCSSHVKSS